MPSTFKGLNLFASGPHRFMVGKQGPFVFSLSALGSPSAESIASGVVELDVTVKGRLIAANDTALWALKGAITAQLLDPPTAGTLIDSHAHSFADMSFISFVEGDRTDRGRAVTLAYVALFRRFTHAPA
ncbi:MAG: hypothetical protein AABZ53_06895 [Planctomycetota bacterium]